VSRKSDAGSDHTRKVSRLPPLPADLDPQAAALFADAEARGGHVLNLHLTSAHAPRLAKARRGYTVALRNECASPRLMRELAILRTAVIVGCDYELDHHRPLGSKAGLTDAQIAAVLHDWRKAAGLFEEPQRAVLAYVDQLCGNQGEVDDATFAALAEHFSPEEIVELTQCSTSYYANGLYIKALRIERDSPDRKAAPGKF
jgi:AhpD family alkylhydroperoxidase